MIFLVCCRHYCTVSADTVLLSLYHWYFHCYKVTGGTGIHKGKANAYDMVLYVVWIVGYEGGFSVSIVRTILCLCCHHHVEIAIVDAVITVVANIREGGVVWSEL